MNQQRIQLLGIYLAEYRKLIIGALKAVRLFNEAPNQEKLGVKVAEKSPSLEHRINQLTTLINNQEAKRIAMRVRQANERLEFDQRVDFEPRWHPVIALNWLFSQARRLVSSRRPDNRSNAVAVTFPPLANGSHQHQPVR